MIWNYIASFIILPFAVKKRIIRYTIRKRFGFKLSKYDVIWASLFLFMAKNKAHLTVKNSVYQISFEYGIKPITVRIRPRLSADIFTFFQLFIANEYQTAFDFIKEHRIKTIIDCGANVGYFSIQALFEYPDAKIVCVEPALDNFQELEENLKINASKSSYQLMHAAIWPIEEEITISNTGEEWAYQVQKSASSNKVKGLSLPHIKSMSKLEKIDLLKIDIEGTEDLLFKDQDFLDILKNDVKFLVIEIHDHLTSREFIYEKLDACGFNYFDQGELTICSRKNEK